MHSRDFCALLPCISFPPFLLKIFPSVLTSYLSRFSCFIFSKISFVFSFIVDTFGSIFLLESGDSSSAVCILRSSSFKSPPSFNGDNFGVAILCLKSFWGVSVT
uniref:Uncharacterized protein n=1 Tax=Meloidogyne enterolobii TaxID=390850 RepID=A0A6V7V3K5_MELEN|nr:unnamed protein product [Meloidogyne enterolobii]